MTKISEVYDAVLNELATLYPSKTKIPNPYSLEDNQQQFLRDGYGLTVEGNSRVEGEFKSISLEYSMTVIVTKEIVRTDSDDQLIDVTTKELLEDIFAGQKRFFQVDELGISDKIRIMDLGSSATYETFVAGNNNFISGSYELLIQIKEDI